MHPVQRSNCMIEGLHMTRGEKKEMKARSRTLPDRKEFSLLHSLHFPEFVTYTLSKNPKKFLEMGKKEKEMLGVGSRKKGVTW